MSGEGVVVTHGCKHCGDPCGRGANGSWVHIHTSYHGGRTALYRCQHTVPYGQNAEPGERR